MVDDKRNKQYVPSDFLAAVNEIQKAGSRYFVVLCGLPNLQLNVKKARYYSERMYRSIEVGNLDDAAATLAIENALEGTSYKFETQLVKAMVEDTGGYPYFVQFYGKETISNTTVSNITQKDYERIKLLIVTQLDADFFEPRFELASSGEQKALCAMSRYVGTNIRFGFIKKGARMSKSDASVSLSRLEKKGMAYSHKRGEYRFSLPMFLNFLTRKCNKST